jgi:uncharacterized delta-60 repeat protein
MRSDSWCDLLERRTHLSAADFDTTFAGTGRRATPFTTVVDVAVQPDGKVLAAGDLNGNQMGVARYRTDGTPDSSFGGGDGRVSLPFTDEHSGQPVHLGAFTLLPDGRILAVGIAAYQMVYALYLPDGSPDTTLSPSGAEAIDYFTQLPGVTEVGVDADGGLIVAGTLGDDDGTFDVLTLNDRQFQIDRNPVDPEVIGRHDAATGLAVGPDGKIVVVGNDAALGGFVGRLNPDLTLDPTFGPIGVDTPGWVVLGPSFTPTSVAVLPTGRILVGGEGEAGVERLLANGMLDTGYGGGDGQAAQDFSVADVALQPDGRLVVVGRDHAAVAKVDLVRRLNYDGSPDTSFDGGDGQVSAKTGLASAVALGPGGKIVVGGQRSVARLNGSPPPADKIVLAGTANADTIRVTQSGTTLTAKVNGVTRTFGTAGKTKLVINGLAGDDTLFVDKSVKLDAFLYGGRGRDRLHGGGGRDEFFGGSETDTVDFSDATAALTVRLNDLADDGPAGNENVHADVENVLGGAGNDTLVGSVLANVLVGNGGADTLSGFAGRDVLIGGKGADTLNGVDGDDLLVGASTVYDANLPFLLTIGFEWRNPENPYATRVARLTAGVMGAKLSAANVPNDLAVDLFGGGSERDWFLYHAGDSLTDREAGETATKL